MAAVYIPFKIINTLPPRSSIVIVSFKLLILKCQTIQMLYDESGIGAVVMCFPYHVSLLDFK